MIRPFTAVWDDGIPALLSVPCPVLGVFSPWELAGAAEPVDTDFFDDLNLFEGINFKNADKTFIVSVAVKF